MPYTIESTVKLNNGVEMPRFGLGTFRTPAGKRTQDAVRWALDAGYRAVDTAAAYENEAAVGKAIRDHQVSPDEVFVTTKAWVNDLSYDGVKAAFDASLDCLALPKLDLYLVHWPANDWQGAWRAMEELYQSGRVRAIGVSNFLEHHLKDLFKFATVTPVVNQIEYHPHLQQPNLQALCREHDIYITAWAPLMKGRVLDIPELVEIGERHNKSAIQVTLRWMLQTDILTIPKSDKQSHIESNAQIFDFELSDDEIERINSLDQHERIGTHPDQF